MAVDWDGDNDLDLVVGNFSGTFYYFLGEGQGRFPPKPEQIMTDNGPLKIDGPTAIRSPLTGMAMVIWICSAVPAGAVCNGPRTRRTQVCCRNFSLSRC